MHIRQSVQVTKQGHARHGEAGIIETIESATGKMVKGKAPVTVVYGVRFDTPDPDGELVKFGAKDLKSLPGR